jgi:hypothetical protein
LTGKTFRDILTKYCFNHIKKTALPMYTGERERHGYPEKGERRAFFNRQKTGNPFLSAA